jgi:hypothetical protein
MIDNFQTTSSTERPGSPHDLDALLGFRFEIASGRSAIFNRTRAGSMNSRPAAPFCRHGVGR